MMDWYAGNANLIVYSLSVLPGNRRKLVLSVSFENVGE
jgi:hypothetical protein